MYSKTNEPAYLKVSGKTQPNKLGSAIAKYLKEAPSVQMTAMGEAAVNVAVKGIIIAQSFVAYEANELQLKIGFDTRYDEMLGKEVTVIVFYIQLQPK